MSSSQARLQSLAGQLTPAAGKKNALFNKNDDDVVITLALRTPLTKARKGYLKDTKLDELLLPVLTAIKEKSKLDPSLVEEIVLGNVLHPSSTFVIRTAAIAAGFPATAAASTVSRWCSSGLLAVQSVANQISAGCIDIGIAIGAESMSTNPDTGAPDLSEKVLNHKVAFEATQLMGWTSENVAGDFGITREAQDAFAAGSQQKAEKSQKGGWPVDEIIPITTQWKNPATGNVETVVADRDDGVRYGTTKEALGKIKAAFPQWKPSTTTGGNASQITDGAAGLLLMRRSVANQLGQPILAKFAASTVTGLEPRVMGIGPTIAIPKLLSKVGLSLEDIDIFEINEAFASMGVYCVEKLGLDPAKVNPRGGAIAFGHPLGCTGARQIVTALSELKRQKKRVAVTSMCVGTGMGMASLIISEQ
ncbi:acetyl-CoA acetyltransferase [Phlyctema vagabunda]|uniref:acetyl-CoA C-acyltransferase n=1 Tax=Phlyctema vagabunda TaxID=108571 RepID=A0ABR4PTM7_9HELO